MHRTTRLKVVTSIAVPLRPIGSSEPATMVLETSDPKLLAAARDAERKVTELDLRGSLHNPSEIARIRTTLEKALIVDVPPFQARVDGLPNSKLVREMPDLPPGAVFLREVSRGKPGLAWPVCLLVIGGLWALGALGSFLSLARGPGQNVALDSQ